MAEDGYERWYSGRLWGLLPAIYRTQDDGALRELVDRIGGQIALVRRGLDRLDQNLWIDTADDWAVPYIGDLLATRIVSALDARAQRLDVARTIYYRRRAGTVGLLEELSSDIAGRDARVVEFFRRLGRTRHRLDPPIGALTATGAQTVAPAVIEGLAGAFSRTQAGGFADLRNVYAAASAHTAFDEFSHTADFRRGRQSVGWHNIPRLGVFVWPLHAYPIVGATPVERAGCPGQFTFDPSGRDIPLFAAPQRSRQDFGEHWIAPDEWRLPAPVRRVLWCQAPDKLYPAAFFVGLGGGLAPAPVPRDQLGIEPEQGRFRFLISRPDGRIVSTYRFGFSGPVGAGGYDERTLPVLDRPAPAIIVQSGGGLDAALAGIGGDATVEIADSATYPGPAASASVPAGATVVLRAANQTRPVLRWAAPGAWEIKGAAGASLVLQGLYLQGADLVLTGTFERVRLRMMTLDPGTSGAGETPPALFGAAVDGLPLAPSRLFIEADIGELILERCITGPIRTRNGGAVERLTISDSIVQSIPTFAGLPDPLFDAASLAAELKTATDPIGKAVRDALPAAMQTRLDAYKLGTPPTAVLTGGLTTALAGFDPAKLARRFPLALADLALGLASGTASLTRTTVMGPTYTHRLNASEGILDDLATVEDPQHGCVRFSTYADGSNLHAPYRCVRIRPGAPVFVTRLFGRPSYARLRRDADSMILAPGPGQAILAGAQDGSEPGAFCSERAGPRRRGLEQKYLEYMPIGLWPVWIEAD